jgi:hypothetical protein
VVVTVVGISLAVDRKDRNWDKTAENKSVAVKVVVE